MNTILVAEDDPGIGELMKAILTGAGYQVMVCSHGKEVAAAVEQVTPALIFMDLWLPGAEGSALTKKLKKDKATKHIPVIIVSAQNKLDTIAKKVKADGFLAKPFEVADLLAIAKKYTK